jgi:hypothetical protein
VTVAKLWILSCAVASALLAQPQPSLRITSPTDGTEVHPGDSLKVTVTASGTFQQVFLVGGDPIGFSQPLLAPPYEFTIQIPSHIRPDRYLLTADGFTSPGQRSPSDPITLVVERSDAPVSLKVFPSLLRLSEGGKGYISVSGVFADGQTVNLTQSTLTSYTSNAPGIVAVEATNTTVLETERATKRATGKLVEDVASDGDTERGDGCGIMPCVTNRYRRAGGISRELWVRVV